MRKPSEEIQGVLVHGAVVFFFTGLIGGIIWLIIAAFNHDWNDWPVVIVIAALLAVGAMADDVHEEEQYKREQKIRADAYKAGFHSAERIFKDDK